ncbi:endonuclease-reverse transcriptase [Plakobranchus ocellatus]|uniref:Endonuclease-reverse transcriptase n=1 Tax=Plakobranchus ocellatus TaxID=259542 RepID=A0AAV4CF94_9GAST|nr:endonuclease-reverse transcriptase [Plakobranchus ocellatus]
MWFITRMMRISRTEKKSNELVLKEANLERSLIKTIRQRQLQFLGHICRHKGLEHLAITGKIEGKRSRGRQRITLIENLKSWAIGKGSNNTFIRFTENRWGTVVLATVHHCARENRLGSAMAVSLYKLGEMAGNYRSVRSDCLSPTSRTSPARVNRHR